MKMLRYALIAISLLFPSLAQAATCFWVGGTGTWSTSNTASWASSTGGTGGSCAATGGIPKQSADTATFDGSSGGGTVTVDTTINGVTLTQITMGAFTGTLDFSVNNPSITLTTEFSITGTGTRTLKLGSGTFTISNTAGGTIWDVSTATNLTLNAGTSTLAFTPSSATGQTRTVVLGTSQTYSTVSFGSNPTSGGGVTISATTSTIGTLLVSSPNILNFGQSSLTFTNAWSLAGSSLSSMIYINGSASADFTFPSSGSTCSWCIFKQVIAITNSITANNSINLGGNTNITINNPSSGGGGHIIGG